MDDKEKGRIEERDRCLRLVIGEIAGYLNVLPLWEDHPTIDLVRKKELVDGLTAEMTAVATLGSKMFGYKRETLIEYAKQQLSKETE